MSRKLLSALLAALLVPIGATANDIVDVAPEVFTTYPMTSAIDVPVNANISINFSEPVNVTGTWFGMVGSTSGLHQASFSGGPGTFTLDPSIDFAGGELISVTIYAANVSDQDANDPPDNMVANFGFSFTTIGASSAPEPSTLTLLGLGLAGLAATRRRKQ